MKKTLVVIALSTMVSGSVFAQGKPKLDAAKKAGSIKGKQELAVTKKVAGQKGNEVGIQFAKYTPEARQWLVEQGAISRTTGRAIPGKMVAVVMKEVTQMMKDGLLPRTEVLEKVGSSVRAKQNIKSTMDNNPNFSKGLVESIVAKKDVNNPNYKLENALIVDALMTAATNKGKLKNAESELNIGFAAAMYARGGSAKEIMDTFEGKDRIVLMINNFLSSANRMTGISHRSGNALATLRDSVFEAVLGKAEYKKAKGCKI